ncbi:hypothetical protein HGRIS_008702 [Hohenbuehelia grisea]|uniref:Uncharacterized protein n=1 Tax=Hohenbuehelia grisea TaxID=104357 RepID=A0ABR3J9A8_9AGAR
MPTNPESTLAQHQPAGEVYLTPVPPHTTRQCTHKTRHATVKVGGRRLSVTSRPKVHHATENTTTTKTEDQQDETNVIDDYPRPAPPGEERDHAHPPPHDDEGLLKREKKQSFDAKESKLDANRPTRDLQGGHKGYGAGGRIAQPAGKGFGA